MTGQFIAAIGVAITVSGCAALMHLPAAPVVIDEYAGVRVRIYRYGLHCRVEVITATDTIQTFLTRCAVIPLRHIP